MNIEIKSTSYLIPNNSSWENLHKDNKLKFAEYNNIFNNTKFNQKTECEIFVLFLKDIIDYYKVLKNINLFFNNLINFFRNLSVPLHSVVAIHLRWK